MCSMYGRKSIFGSREGRTVAEAKCTPDPFFPLMMELPSSQGHLTARVLNLSLSSPTSSCHHIIKFSPVGCRWKWLMSRHSGVPQKRGMCPLLTFPLPPVWETWSSRKERTLSMAEPPTGPGQTTSGLSHDRMVLLSCLSHSVFG